MKRQEQKGSPDLLGSSQARTVYITRFPQYATKRVYIARAPRFADLRVYLQNPERLREYVWDDDWNDIMG